jgi:DASS family divalent anion:Na+ symporter
MLYLGVSVLIGFLIYLFPEPAGVSANGWHLFAIFIATMIAVILKPLPMGLICILSLTITVATNTLSFAEAFSGFSNEIVWLVVFAFFVAKGFIATGLGARTAYKVLSILGKNSLGLGYGLVATDLLLAPAIPSVTARLGGIVFPIVKSLSELFSGKFEELSPKKGQSSPTAKEQQVPCCNWIDSSADSVLKDRDCARAAVHDPKMGGFLTLTSFQGSAVTSAMFLTAMAGNPMIVELAKGQGIEINWGTWALAAIVPGLFSLIAVPYVLYKIAAPTIKQTPHAKEMAQEKLKAMGPMSIKEWIMISTFFLLICLWILGPFINMKATVATMIGLTILLLTNVLSWKNIIEETSAWDTFIWFATLVTLSGFLNKLGLTTWFSHLVVSHMAGFEWIIGFFLIALIYFYTHYFFASNVAHIGAMYAPLLIVAISLGTPVQLAALTLAFFSNLFGGLTHYGSGPAPIFFGAGYVQIRTWWKMGFMISILNIAIWLTIGGLWWKLLGLW